MSECIFCDLAAGRGGGKLAYQDDAVVAFHDLHPQAPVHVLIVPRQHTPGLSATEDDALLGRLLAAARRVAATLALTDYRVVINNGAQAGQSVFHLHLHLLGGRPFGWPPG
ncbi:MAG TPA: HIT domain-containing protein [Candidatus Aminicenantes bacterium]|nr:HIT domain-containing protein [Candidatus Aminicenantes bacterium]